MKSSIVLPFCVSLIKDNHMLISVSIFHLLQYVDLFEVEQENLAPHRSR